jgi:hypothetical protein
MTEHIIETAENIKQNGCLDAGFLPAPKNYFFLLGIKLQICTTSLVTQTYQVFKAIFLQSAWGGSSDPFSEFNQV